MKYMQFLISTCPENSQRSLTDEQIKQFEGQYGIHFPESMYEFYKLTGGGYYWITSLDASSLSTVNEIIDEIENDPTSIYRGKINANEIFPFGDYGGELFFVYRKDLTLEDPPVYVYTHGGMPTRNIPPRTIAVWENTFSQWIQHNFQESQQLNN